MEKQQIAGVKGAYYEMPTRPAIVPPIRPPRDPIKEIGKGIFLEVHYQKADCELSRETYLQKTGADLIFRLGREARRGALRELYSGSFL